MSIKSKKLQLFGSMIGFLLILFIGSSNAVSAQQAKSGASAQNSSETSQEDEEGSKQIKLTDITKERPPAKPEANSEERPNTQTASSSAPSWNAPTYRRVIHRASPRPVNRRRPRASGGSTPRIAKTARVEEPEATEIGVTVWRLRQAKTTDNGPSLVVMHQNRLTKMVPERIEGTSPVHIGDYVRLSIESPRTGYLYVINRVQYADGTTSEPKLIFPTMHARGGDNKVVAGRLIDIPDQQDQRPVFTLTKDQKPGQPEQTGELLTILVTPQPIEELSIGLKPLTLEFKQVAEWQDKWGGQLTDLLEMNGGTGQTWTKREKEASMEGGRSLTQEDPTPQTVYRVTPKNNGVMVTVQLLYDQTNPAKK